MKDITTTSYLLRLIGLPNNEIDEANTEIFGSQQANSRNIFIQTQPDTSQLLETPTTTLFNTLSKLGIDTEIMRTAELLTRKSPNYSKRTEAERQTEIKRKTEQLNEIIKRKIDDLRADPTPSFMTFCYLVFCYNQQYKVDNEQNGRVYVENSIYEHYGLNISTLLKIGANLSQDEQRNVITININHNPNQKWEARVLGTNPNILQAGNNDVGLLVNALAVYKFIQKKNSSSDKGIWNGMHTRVSSLNRTNPETQIPVVTINTCMTDYVSHLATNYGLLERDFWNTERINPESLKLMSSQFKTALLEKQALLEASEDGTLDLALNTSSDFDTICSWSQEKIKETLEKVKNIADHERALSISDINDSLLANCLSVNVIYIKGGYVFIQERGNANHGKVKYQASAAGFVGLPANYKNSQEKTPHLMTAIRHETEEEMGMSFDSCIEAGTMHLTGIVRDRYNCETGVLAMAKIKDEWYRSQDNRKINEVVEDNDVVKITIETGAETKDFVKLPFEPKRIFLFVLRNASHRNDIFEPWNDFMPLGAAALIYALIKEFGERLVQREWKEAIALYESEQPKLRS